VGAALAVLFGVLGIGLPAGLDIAPLDQAIALLALGWVAGLAFCLGWPLVEQARPWTEPRRGWPVAIGAPNDQPRLALTTTWRTGPVMTAGALAGVSYRIRAFGVH